MGLGKAVAGSGSTTATVMGYAMTLGACVYKAPVIRNILKAKSTLGLSPIAIYLETSGLLAYIAYNFYRENPISSYGDVIITVMQELVIVFCILLMGGTTTTASASKQQQVEEQKADQDRKEEKYEKIAEKSSVEKQQPVAADEGDKKQEVSAEPSAVTTTAAPQSLSHILSLLLAACVFFFLIHLGVTTSSQTQSYVISYAIAVKVLAKVPQIIKNFTDRKVGVQSLFTAGTACLGPIVKFYIAIVQIKDPLLVGGAVITMLLNLVVFTQILMFRTSKKSQEVSKKDKTD
jgi:large-conductance mechanosensitive channel